MITKSKIESATETIDSAVTLFAQAMKEEGRSLEEVLQQLEVIFNDNVEELKDGQYKI